MMPTIAAAILEHITGRFSPTTAPDTPAGTAITLHQAVRAVFGTDPDTALVCYRDHNELRHDVNGVWAALDDALPDTAAPHDRASWWAIRPERTETDITNLITRSRLTGLPVPGPASVRPGLLNMPGGHKPRGVICASIALALPTTEPRVNILTRLALAYHPGALHNLRAIDWLDTNLEVLDIPQTTDLGRLLSNTWRRTSNPDHLGDFIPTLDLTTDDALTEHLTKALRRSDQSAVM